MSQYFFEQYKIRLADNQPLLVVTFKKGDSIYLPTQLCHEASLPKDFTKDFRKAQDIQPYKITSADKRLAKIMKIVRDFQNDSQFEKWGIEMSQEPINITGEKLHEPVLDHSGRRATFRDFTDRKIQHMQPLKMQNNDQFVFAYHHRDYKLVEEVMKAFSTGAGSLGMSFAGEPIWIEVPDDRDIQLDRNKLRNGGAFEYCIRSDLEKVNPKSVEIVIVLIPRAEDKAKVKRCLDSMGFASQFLLVKNYLNLTKSNH